MNAWETAEKAWNNKMDVHTRIDEIIAEKL